MFFPRAPSLFGNTGITGGNGFYYFFFFSLNLIQCTSSRRFQPVRILRGHFAAKLVGRQTVVRHDNERENGTVRRTPGRVHQLFHRTLQTDNNGGVQRGRGGSGQRGVHRSRRMCHQGIVNRMLNNVNGDRQRFRNFKLKRNFFFLAKLKKKKYTYSVRREKTSRQRLKLVRFRAGFSHRQ